MISSGSRGCLSEVAEGTDNTGRNDSNLEVLLQNNYLPRLRRLAQLDMIVGWFLLGLMIIEQRKRHWYGLFLSSAMTWKTSDNRIRVTVGGGITEITKL